MVLADACECLSTRSVQWTRFATLSALILAAAPSVARSNDSAAAIGVGGLQPLLLGWRGETHWPSDIHRSGQ